ncbi:transcription initiation factor IIE subunit alpha-like [Contarinia nasturtii]|uniref:transcription initiation factor IIE subunit alpha-like n=1 Tax=Contarinia nasturtii TaxID=265458 RepID=UPI0012D4C38C|nr:transcription initiation factor IIE subunit alpha-like [Contarinia nasturtii]XP_031634217.1 transcription initiation factor IIE subunit alpha-like [Contarinia nasturtii]
MRPKRTCVNETNERIRIYSEWANSQRQRQPTNNASANSQQTEPTQNQDEEEEENQSLDVTVDNSQQTEPTQEHVDVQDGVHQSIEIQLEQCTPCTVGLEVMSQNDSETQYFNRYRATNTTGSKRRKVIESDDDDDDDDDVVDAHSNVTHTPSLVSPQTSTQSKRVRFDQNNRQQQRPSNSSSHNSPIHQNIQNAGTSSTHNQIEMECQNVFSSMTRIIASNAAHRQIVHTEHQIEFKR